MKIWYFSVLLMSIVTHAYAGPAPDLALSLNGPANPQVNTAAIYQINLLNKGNKDASMVKVEVNFPLTNTSPQKFILGTVSAFDVRCALASNKLTCNLGTLKRGKSMQLNFSYAAPVANKDLDLNLKSSSSVADGNQSDNDLVRRVLPQYFVYQINGPILAHNSHCTGTGLSAYFECEKFPSSISEHNATFLANGTISFENEPAYWGFWQQNPDLNELTFQYYDSSGEVAHFSGKGSLANCFDGITEFVNSTYNSAYRVCF